MQIVNMFEALKNGSIDVFTSINIAVQKYNQNLTIKALYRFLDTNSPSPPPCLVGLPCRALWRFEKAICFKSFKIIDLSRLSF